MPARPRCRAARRRQGRRFDFAQWYPKVVVYDKHGWQDHPLYPGGRVLRGVRHVRRWTSTSPRIRWSAPPGYRSAAIPDGSGPTRIRGRCDYQRDYYGRRGRRDGATAAPARGTGPQSDPWYAPRSASLRVLAESRLPLRGRALPECGGACALSPGDRAHLGQWRGGGAHRDVRSPGSTRLFGPFRWPQLTNLHRIEGAGPSFP